MARLNLKTISPKVAAVVLPRLREQGFRAKSPTEVMRSDDQGQIYFSMHGSWRGDTGALVLTAGAVPRLGALPQAIGLERLALYAPGKNWTEDFLLGGLLAPLQRQFPADDPYAYQGKALDQIVADIGKLFDEAVKWASSYRLENVRADLSQAANADWAADAYTDHSAMFTFLVGQVVAELGLGDIAAVVRTRALMEERAADPRLEPHIAELVLSRWLAQVDALLASQAR